MASSFQAITNAIRAHWDTNVATSGVTLPTRYENEYSEPPDDAAFCMMQIRMDGREPSSAVGDGKGRPRHTGAIAAQLYYPGDEGEADAWAAVDLIADVFDGLILAGPPQVTFAVCNSRSAGQDRGRMRVDFFAPFFSDEV